MGSLRGLCCDCALTLCLLVAREEEGAHGLRGLGLQPSSHRRVRACAPSPRPPPVRQTLGRGATARGGGHTSDAGELKVSVGVAAGDDQARLQSAVAVRDAPRPQNGALELDHVVVAAGVLFAQVGCGGGEVVGAPHLEGDVQAPPQGCAAANHCARVGRLRVRPEQEVRLGPLRRVVCGGHGLPAPLTAQILAFDLNA